MTISPLHNRDQKFNYSEQTLLRGGWKQRA
jgi:hypothetical protein